MGEETIRTLTPLEIQQYLNMQNCPPKNLDAINHPAHYTHGKIEVLDFILDQDLPYLPSNAIKYICRYRWKGSPVEDIKKAVFYLNRLVQELEKCQNQK